MSQLQKQEKKPNDDPISTVLAELRGLKLEIIDDGHQSEILYVIGGKELEKYSTLTESRR